MDKRDPFEQKIKEKLESLSSPLPDLDQAWVSFSPKIQPEGIPLWKRWFMPYLYATTLFVLSLWWHQREQNGDFVTENPFEGESIVDTIVARDTIYLIDTVYLVKRIYVAENQLVKSQNSFSGKENEQHATLSQITSDERISENQIDQTKRTQESKEVQLSALNKPTYSNEKSNSSKPEHDKPLTKPTQRVDSVSQLSQIALRTDSVAPKRPRSMSAPSIGPKQNVVIKSDMELVVGDTSNLSNPPIRAKSKPMLYVEAVTSIMFPISGLVEYYTPIQNGF